MRDYVIVLLRRCPHHPDQVRAELHCIPAFLRFPLLGNDDEVLEATRSMLVLKGVVDAEAREFAAIKRLEASGATSFIALPKQRGILCHLGKLMHPWVAYSTFALTQLRFVTDHRYSLADLVTTLYGIVVPHECPACHDAMSWAVLRADTAVCVSCGYLT